MYLAGEEEIEAIARVIRSGKLFRYRDESECERFEKRYAKHLGVSEFALGVSGTYGLGKPLRCMSEKGARVMMRKPTPPAPAAGLKQALWPSASKASTAATSWSSVRTRHHGGSGIVFRQPLAGDETQERQSREDDPPGSQALT